VIKNPFRTRDRATCSCNKYLCDICAYRLHTTGAVHKPFVQTIDEHLTREARLSTLLTGAYRDGSPTKLILGD
jgi:hypothetical protein